MSILESIENLIPKNENGFYEIKRLLTYANKRVTSYLKIAASIQNILDLAAELGIKIKLKNSRYVRLSKMREIGLLIFTENPKEIYLHPGLIDSFIDWINLKYSMRLIHFLENYKPEKKTQNERKPNPKTQALFLPKNN